MCRSNARILFINNTSLMGAGTSQSLLLMLKYFQESFEIFVVSDRHSQELTDALADYYIPHYGFRDRTVFFLPQLIFHILRHKIDLVYGNNLSGRSRVAFYAAKITGRPFIWHIRESVRDNDSRTKEVHFADAVISNSEDTAERLRKFAHVKSPIVVPNGIDLDDFKIERNSFRKELIETLEIPEDATLIVNMGRVCHQKNQLEVIKICEPLIQKFKNLHCMFLGDFQDHDYLSDVSRK